MLATPQQQAALVSVFRKGTKLTYKKGEFIIHPGETPVGVFFVESGIVKAYDISKYGEENLLSIRRRKEIFPLIWAITGQDRQIIYEALGPTTLWRISREDYLEHINKNPEMLRPLLDMTLDMYRIHSERILNLEYRTVRERLISFLITTAERFGKKGAGKSIIVNLPLKQQDIASSISATRETTSRELMRLERLGLISNHQSVITLVEPDKLRSFL
jgi:CRP/FNR family transcriptional regulator